MLRLPRLRCWLCRRAAIYTCPACDAVSCSLACCLRHKEVAECDGAIPDFISLVQYDFGHLARDVGLIERLQTGCAASVGALRGLAPAGPSGAHGRRQKALFRAYEDVGARVVFLPRGASKSLENVSTPERVYATLQISEISFRASLRFGDPPDLLRRLCEQTYACQISAMFLRLDGCRFKLLRLSQALLEGQLAALLQDLVIYEFPQFVAFTQAEQLPPPGDVCERKEQLQDEWLDEWGREIENSEY